MNFLTKQVLKAFLCINLYITESFPNISDLFVSFQLFSTLEKLGMRVSLIFMLISCR